MNDEKELNAARAVVQAAWELISGDDHAGDPPCSECGLAGVGNLREKLHAFHKARGEPVPTDGPMLERLLKRQA